MNEVPIIKIIRRIPGRLRGPGHGGPAAAVPGPADPGGLLQGQVQRQRWDEALPRGVGGDAQGTLLRSEALLQFRYNRNFFVASKNTIILGFGKTPRASDSVVYVSQSGRDWRRQTLDCGYQVGTKRPTPCNRCIEIWSDRQGKILSLQNGVGIEDEVVGRQQEWNGGRGETVVDTMPMG